MVDFYTGPLDSPIEKALAVPDSYSGLSVEHLQANPAVFESGESSNNVLSVDDLNPVGFGGHRSSYSSIWDGEKFAGGLGPLEELFTDYWALRKESSNLFHKNLYARGLIRRLITNIINSGLSPECVPDEAILGLEDGSLNDWAETTENRFGLWGKNAQVCDWERDSTFGAIQRTAYSEALVAGDVLVVLRQDQRTKLPRVQLIKGENVRTPFGSEGKIRKGHRIKHGVELDRQNRKVAYWIQQEDGESKRLPAFGEKSGRRIAWLIYGTDKRHGEVRGQPLLSLILQSLRELDRYRDAATRKAVVNSLTAFYVKKTQDKIGSLPMTGAAINRATAAVSDADGTPRSYNITGHLPGAVMEDTQHGEEIIQLGGQGTDVSFGPFEEAIVQTMAWACELPPEILRLTFSSNYSASQAAINEFRITTNREWSDFGETFCTPIFIEYLVSETLMRKTTAPGLLESWRDDSQYDIFGAWTATLWYGSIKPSTDMLKQGKGSDLLLQMGLTTHAREARITTGTKFSKNVKRLAEENRQLAEAKRPMLELQREFKGDVNDDGTKDAVNALEDAAITLVDAMEDISNGG